MQNKGLWITLGIIGLVVVGFFAITASDQQTQTTSPTPTTQQLPTTSQASPTTDADENDQESVSVIMTNNSFEPSNITIQEGETTIWENQDSVLHTVTIEDLDVDEDVDPGDSFSYTFDEVGTYDLNCSVHADMDGEITVESNSTTEVENDTSIETDTETNLDTENGLY